MASFPNYGFTTASAPVSAYLGTAAKADALDLYLQLALSQALGQNIPNGLNGSPTPSVATIIAACRTVILGRMT